MHVYKNLISRAYIQYSDFKKSLWQCMSKNESYMISNSIDIFLQNCNNNNNNNNKTFMCTQNFSERWYASWFKCTVSVLKSRHKYLHHIPINLKLGHQQDNIENAVSALGNTSVQILTPPFSNHKTLDDFFKYEVASVVVGPQDC